MMPGKRNRNPPAEQLRDDIDSGRTGDNVVHADPAAAPLGADDEVGGNPSGPEQMREARREERSRDPGASTNPVSPGRPPRQDRLARDLRLLWEEMRSEPAPGRLTEAARRLEGALKMASYPGTRKKR